MYRSATCVVVLAAVMLGGCGGGDTPESISKLMLANFDQMATILHGITDEASAKAAVPKIEAVRASMRDLAARSKPLKIDEAASKKLEAELGPKMEAAQASLQAAMLKLMAKPELVEIIEPAMQDMDKDL